MTDREFPEYPTWRLGHVVRNATGDVYAYCPDPDPARPWVLLQHHHTDQGMVGQRFSGEDPGAWLDYPPPEVIGAPVTPTGERGGGEDA